MQNLFSSPLGRSLVIHIFLASSVFTLIYVAAQLYRNFESGVEQLEETFYNVESTLGTPLADALWRFDEEQVDVILNSIIQKNHIEHLVLKDKTGFLNLERGSKNSIKYPLVRTSNLIYNDGQKTHALGALEIELNKDMVIQQVWDDFIFILLFQFFKTLFLTIIILYLVVKIVIYPLNNIAKAIDKIDLNTTDTTIEIPSNHKLSLGSPNEFSVIERAINLMRIRIIESMSIRERLISEQERNSRNIALGALSGNVAHELNNILQAILGFSGSAERRFLKGDTEKATASMKKVTDAVARGTDVVKEILRFVSDRQESLKLMDVSLEIENSLDLMRKNLKYPLKYNCAGLPSGTVCKGSRLLLYQILSNLTKNASDAMETHGCKGEIKITLELTDTVIIRVEDNGPGIPPEFIEKIFMPFESTKSAEKGTGLGLSIVKSATEKMNGEISVNSELGRGTEFKVLLPLARRMDCDANNSSQDKTQ
jgi:signal transduction histidine kinase